MQIYFHSCLCSYLPREPILVEGRGGLAIWQTGHFPAGPTYFLGRAVRAIFPGRVLARISILPKISRIWLCLRVQTDRCMMRFLMFSKRISRYSESKQYRNPGKSWENGTYGHPTIHLLIPYLSDWTIKLLAAYSFFCLIVDSAVVFAAV